MILLGSLSGTNVRRRQITCKIMRIRNELFRKTGRPYQPVRELMPAKRYHLIQLLFCSLVLQTTANAYLNDEDDNVAAIQAEIEVPDETVITTITLYDDGNDNTEKIELFCDGQVIARTCIDQAEYMWKTTIMPRDGSHYYFVKVAQNDGDKIWSGPMWVNSFSQLPPTPLALTPLDDNIISALLPTFRWSDPAGDETFTLQCSSSPDFPEDASTVTINDIAESNYTLGQQLQNTQYYYWRVAAENNNGTSSYSAVCKFYTDAEAIFASDTEIRLTNNIENDCRPAMLEYSNGLVWFFFNSSRTGNSEIFYKTSDDGGNSWSIAARITSNGEADHYPDLTQDSEGNIHLVCKLSQPV